MIDKNIIQGTAETIWADIIESMRWLAKWGVKIFTGIFLIVTPVIAISYSAMRLALWIKEGAPLYMLPITIVVFLISAVLFGRLFWGNNPVVYEDPATEFMQSLREIIEIGIFIGAAVMMIAWIYRFMIHWLI